MATRLIGFRSILSCRSRAPYFRAFFGSFQNSRPAFSLALAPEISTPVASPEPVTDVDASFLTASAVSWTGEVKRTIELHPRVFGSPLRRDILQRCVEYHRAKRRKGTFKAKDRSEVSGSGKKMWRQKGTGRARVGDKRPPHWRGGGVAHGPVVRAFEKGLQKKVIQFGLRVALSARHAERRLVILDSDALPSHKTQELQERLTGLGLANLVFIGNLKVDENLRLAARSLPNVDIMNSLSVTSYDILRRQHVLITAEAVEALTLRLTRRVTAPTDRRTLAKQALYRTRLERHAPVLAAYRASLLASIKPLPPLSASDAAAASTAAASSSASTTASTTASESAALDAAVSHSSVAAAAVASSSRTL